MPIDSAESGAGGVIIWRVDTRECGMGPMYNRRTKYIWSLFLCLFASVATSGCSPKSNGLVMHEKDSLYDRVLASGKIRCGYFLFPPYSMKDPNTGKMAGIFVDALEEAASNLGLKVDWAEEVGYGTMVEGIKTGRYDLVPTGVWPNANRARYADFSNPLFYSGILAYARSDDNRFKNNMQTINDKAITISTIDGTVQDVMARKNFPRAHVLSHPEMSDSQQILLDVTTKKADVTFIEPGLAAIFLKGNPGSLQSITGKKPIAVIANTMMFKLGEPSFKSMLNTALAELINTGYIDRLINKYEPAPGAYFRIARPYETTARTNENI